MAYQFSHQTPRGEITLKKLNKISLGQEDGAAKDEDGRLQTNLLVEGVEGCSGQDEATNVRQQ